MCLYFCLLCDLSGFRVVNDKIDLIAVIALLCNPPVLKFKEGSKDKVLVFPLNIPALPDDFLIEVVDCP